MQTDDDENPAYVNFHNQHLLQMQLNAGYLYEYHPRPISNPNPPVELRGFPTEEDRINYPYPETEYQYLRHFL